jgi:tetratricopeptide (TPR) repeat protein
MPFMRLIICSLTLLWAVGCARQVHIVSLPSTRPVSPTSDAANQIRFWEPRLQRDPENHIARARLASAYLNRARSTGDFADYLRAETVLTPLADRQPPDPTVLTLLSSIKAAQHQFRPALELAEKALAIKPEDPSALAMLADTRLEIGDVAGAESALTRLEELTPGFAASARRANLQLVRGDVSGALASYQAALDYAEEGGVSKENVSWCHIQIGVTNFDHGRFEEAQKHYLAALELTPDSYLALEHLAELRAEQGQTNESLKLYERVIALAPNPEFFEAIGDVYDAAGKKDLAAQWHDRAESGYLAAIDAGNIHYYRFIAKFYSDIRPNPSKALKWASADLNVRADPHSHATLAWALHLNAAHADAARAMDKALAFGTSDAEMFHKAGMIYLAAGDPAKGRTYLAKALQANPRYALPPDAQKHLPEAARSASAQ